MVGGHLRRAVFFDRDGTIIHDAHYLARPEDVRLLPGAARAIRELNDAAIPVVVVTNQSGIARGLLTVADYEAVHAEMERQLAAEDARVDASYFCPHHPDFGGDCECRKPGTLMYRQAAAEHGLDLTASYYIGDRWRDVAPALTLGGHGVLVSSAATPPDERERAAQEASVAESLSEAVARALVARA